MEQAAGSYGTAPPNSHTGKNGDIAANPAILLDDNAPSESLAPASHPTARIDWISGANQFDIWTEYATRADADRARIRYTTVCPDENVITNRNVVAVVAMKGSLNHDTLAHATMWHGGAHRTVPAAAGWRRFWVRPYVHNCAEEAGSLHAMGW